MKFIDFHKTFIIHDSHLVYESCIVRTNKGRGLNDIYHAWVIVISDAQDRDNWNFAQLKGNWNFTFYNSMLMHDKILIFFWYKKPHPSQTTSLELNQLDMFGVVSSILNEQFSSSEVFR